jgi:hypothetical protein
MFQVICAKSGNITQRSIDSVGQQFDLAKLDGLS